jgi:hypothetical protein
MNQHYNQNYTREQIDVILAMIQDCVREGRFIISKNENRQENIDFINEYNLNSRRQTEILDYPYFSPVILYNMPDHHKSFEGYLNTVL